jgi:hypothetical protein
MKTKTLSLFFKILLVILILIPLVFFTYRLVEGHMHDLDAKDDLDYHSGMGLYVFASHTVLLAINAILTLIITTGLLIAKKRNKSPECSKSAFKFRLLVAAPLTSQILYVLITLIVLNVN